MIKYALRCSNDHEFEAWFTNSAAFDDQRGKSLLACPECDTHEVEKALMAPNVVTTKGRGATSAMASPSPSDAPDTSAPANPAPAPTPDGYAPVSSNPHQKKVLELMRQVREHIEATTEDVGKGFAEEARKIHYEEAEARGIRGEATAEEVQDLQEEGIPVTPLPRLPDDHN